MKKMFILIVFWLAGAVVFAQPFGPPPGGGSTNQLSVWLDLKWDTNNAVFHAPAKVDIIGYVGTRSDMRDGDTVKVDFFSGNDRIGSGKAVWHGEIRPDETPGHAIYLHIVAAQFYPAEYVWKRVPPGVYTITARAEWKKFSAVSPPLKVTVLPQ